MSILGPFSVGYPVNFYNGGDTTTEAFQKHIQEIERIYAALNTLDAGKVSNGEVDITSHINASNPHPNLELNTLGGSLTASKVSGALSNATIAAADVTGLSSVIASAVSDKLSVDTYRKTENGDLIFSNGFHIKWGCVRVDNDTSQSDIDFQTARSLTYSNGFATNCAQVVMSISLFHPSGGISSQYPSHDADIGCQLLGWTKSGFTYRIQFFTNRGTWSYAMVNYIALGW